MRWKSLSIIVVEGRSSNPIDIPNHTFSYPIFTPSQTERRLISTSIGIFILRSLVCIPFLSPVSQRFRKGKRRRQARYKPHQRTREATILLLPMKTPSKNQSGNHSSTSQRNNGFIAAAEAASAFDGSKQGNVSHDLSTNNQMVLHSDQVEDEPTLTNDLALIPHPTKAQVIKANELTLEESALFDAWT